ncbi:unnamed protein product, partial [Ilex paraguariensis]
WTRKEKQADKGKEITSTVEVGKEKESDKIDQRNVDNGSISNQMMVCETTITKLHTTTPAPQVIPNITTSNKFDNLVMELQGPMQLDLEKFASPESSALATKIKNIDGIPIGQLRKKHKSPNKGKRGISTSQGHHPPRHK